MSELTQRNERLRQQRFLRNWRLQDVADQLGTTITTVKRWERGNQQPSAYYRVKLCALFELSSQELGLEEAWSEPILPSSVASEATPAHRRAPAKPEMGEEKSNVALWTVPYMRNPYFTGCDRELSLLEERLTASEASQGRGVRQTALTQAQAVTGLGGIGKTQIAVEYAYRALTQKRYLHTLWITAASEEAILTSFAALADLLPAFDSHRETDQRKLVTAVIGWLEQCGQPWLLIFDNADDLSFIPQYLPRWGNGSILLTTRVGAVGAFASAIEVGTMGLMEGIQLLLRRAQRFTNASDEEIHDAANLVAALAQFPLALDQAGAYMEETGCSTRDYLQLYQQHSHTLLARRGMQVSGYPESVITTWSLSFQQIEETNPAAAELLCLCAFLAPDHIPEELLSAGAPYWPPALQEAVTDSLRFNQMLEDLLSFFLVKRLAEDRLLSIHRLVQVVQRERMTPAEQREWAERLLRAVHAVFPSDPTNPAATWAACQRYLEQAQVCNTLIRQYQIVLPEAAEVLDRTATYLRECGLHTLAEPLYLRALRIREQQAGPEHSKLAQTLNNLAGLYWRQGKYGEAASLFQQALRIREQQAGPEHPETAQTMNDLAILYYQLAKYEESESLFLQALRIRELQMEPEHSDIAETLNNLALLYYQQNKYGQAEPLYRRALHIWELQMGPEHSLVAAVLINLAFLYYQQNKYELAEPLYLQALHIWEQQLGPEHPEVSWPLYGLALLYNKQHKEDEAERLFQRALHIREEHSGPEHPETATILHDFAGFQQAHGKTPEAMHMYQRALMIREHVLGADHPMTIKTRACLLEV